MRVRSKKMLKNVENYLSPKKTAIVFIIHKSNQKIFLGSSSLVTIKSFLLFTQFVSKRFTQFELLYPKTLDRRNKKKHVRIVRFYQMKWLILFDGEIPKSDRLIRALN